MYLCDSQRGHKSGSCGSVDTRFGILRVLREIVISDYLTPFSKICLILYIGLSLTTLDRPNGSYPTDYVILQWRLANNRRMSSTFGKVLNGANCTAKK